MAARFWPIALAPAALHRQAGDCFSAERISWLYSTSTWLRCNCEAESRT